LTQAPVETRTPWQKVFARLGLSQADLAGRMGYNRSALSRALNSETGLISGRNQVKLITIGREIDREIAAGDLLPDVERVPVKAED